jgi:hypothetical protein
VSGGETESWAGAAGRLDFPGSVAVVVDGGPRLKASFTPAVFDFWACSSAYRAVGISAGKSLGGTAAGGVDGDAMFVVAGSSGSSGSGGTAGRPSFSFFVAAGALAVAGADAGFGTAAAGTGENGAGDVVVVPEGQAGAALSAASVVPLVVANGGTPSGAWSNALLSLARGLTGPSLIFT